MFNRKRQNQPGELLFDYYDGQTGLPMEPGYIEITLTATDDPKKLKMDVYSRPTGNGNKESKTTYLICAKALDDAMALVKKHKLAHWNKRDYPCMCGRKMVCKFMWKGEFIRVSSENMPEKGKGALAEIRSALYGYVDPAAIFEQADTEFVATLKILHTVQSTMAISRDGHPIEPESAPEPEIITVRAGSLFYGFTVTHVKEDYVRFVGNFFRYIVNNGPIEKEFTLHKGETIRLDMVDILDATDLTVVELLDVTTSDRYV